MKKRLFDFVFIAIATIVLIVLSEYQIVEQYYGFSILLVLLAYFIGQFVERRF